MAYKVSTVAACFARALLTAALENGYSKDKLEAAAIRLAEFYHHIKDEGYLSRLLLNKYVSSIDKTKILLHVCDTLLVPLDPLLVNFLHVLILHRQMQLLHYISTQFTASVLDCNSLVTMKITLAYDASDKQRAQIINDIEKTLKIKTRPTFYIDTKLLGGMVVAVGSSIADFSMQGKLSRLKKALLGDKATVSSSA